MKTFSQLRHRGIEFARRCGAAALSLCYPPHCAMCEADTAPSVHLCATCAERVRKLEPPFCQRCSQPFDGAITGEFTCSNCADRRFHFTCAATAYLARGVVREFIHRFKYDRHFHLRHTLADWMAAGLEDERLRAAPYDAFVPVPLHSARQREREFNQAEVLARLLAQRTGTPFLHCLRRTRYTTTQTRLDRDTRMENLRGAFRVRHPAHVIGRHLILIDDVFTTGSTVEECSRVLCAAGAASVRVLTVARA
jgi:ComF family protein